MAVVLDDDRRLGSPSPPPTRVLLPAAGHVVKPGGMSKSRTTAEENAATG